jgi:hypothetical protein
VNRTQRQQQFLRAIMAEAGSSRNPVKLMQAADKMSTGLRVDDDMTLLDAGKFAWSMGHLDPVTVLLPVTPRTTDGGARTNVPFAYGHCTIPRHLRDGADPAVALARTRTEVSASGSPPAHAAAMSLLCLE